MFCYNLKLELIKKFNLIIKIQNCSKLFILKQSKKKVHKLKTIIYNIVKLNVIKIHNCSQNKLTAIFNSIVFTELHLSFRLSMISTNPLSASCILHKKSNKG